VAEGTMRLGSKANSEFQPTGNGACLARLSTNTWCREKRGSPQALGFYIGRAICHPLKNALFESGSQETERI